MTTTPTPTIYKSRSRTTRRRVLVGAGILALILVGFLIGRLNSGPSAKAAPPAAPSAPGSAPASDSASSAPPPSSAPPAPTGVNAYAPIQAEAANAQQGTQNQDTSDAGGGQNVGWVANGDWLQFNDIDFGATAPKQLVARLSSAVNNETSRMDIRIDDRGSPPIGSMPVRNTGGWDAWRTQATDISAVTGVHTVFLTFASDAGDDFLNLNYFSFNH
jgi:Carbohydrate binding module (family 6)